MRLLLVFFLLVCTNLFAQTDFKPGYIITNSMDTIKGFVDYRGEVRNMKRCNFKESLNSDTKTYLPGEIYGYRYEIGKYYVSKQIDTKDFKDLVFVEFLLKGMINLYYFNNINYAAYFLEDENGKLLEIKHNEVKVERDGYEYIAEDHKYIGLLNYVFREYPQILQLSKNVDLTHKGMINITKKYHDYVCSDQACILYEKKVPVLKIELRPMLGVDISSLNYIGQKFSSYTFDSSISPFVGLGANFIIPRFNEKMSVLISTTLNRDYFYGTDVYHASLYDQYYYLHYYNTNLTTNLSLKYTYPKGQIRPEIIAGIFFKSSVHESGRQDVKIVSQTTVTTSSLDMDLIEGNPKGFIIGAGAEYKLFKKIRFFSNLKYFHGSSKLNFKGDIRMSSWRFSTGVIL